MAPKKTTQPVLKNLKISTKLHVALKYAAVDTGRTIADLVDVGLWAYLRRLKKSKGKGDAEC